MINESQCYINVLSVHHNYITIGPTRDTVILKAGEVAMMGLGVGILSHIKTCLQTRDRWRKREHFLSLVFFLYSNTVSHHNHQEVK